MVWLLIAAAAAQGQHPQTATRPDDPGAIVVTGERTKRSLKETPSSVMVFDKRDIERMAAPDRLQEMLEFVPNVVVPSRRDTPIIRGEVSTGVLAGLPAFLGGPRPRTIVQVDGRTISFNEFAFGSEGLWDVDHVEVFRSPQTTTQGSDSIGGAIFIHTADPSFRFEGHARLIAGQLERRQASAAVSLPLIGDEVALRLSGDLYRGRSSNRLSGPVENVDLNDDHYASGRAKLMLQPHAIPGLNLLVTYAHMHSQAPQVEPARRPFRERRDPLYLFGYPKEDVDSLTSTGTYAVSSSLESRTTISWGRAHHRRSAPQGFGQADIHDRDGSVESILEWKPKAAVSAIGGVSWQAVDLDQFIDLSATPFGTGTFRDRQRSSAAFGEATWHATGRLSLSAGARYQSDSKRRAGVLRTAPELPLDYRKTVSALLPKLSATYDVSGEVRVGALVERAYNPGGVTLNPRAFKTVTFGPEYLWDYEAFVRATAFGGRLSINGNVFYNDIQNAQRTFDFCFATPTGCVGLEEVTNADRAHAYGAEMEAWFKPSSRLTVRGAAGLLRTRTTATLLPTDPIRGKEFAGAPHLTAMAAVDWKPIREVSLSAQLRHTDRYWSDDAETPEFRIARVTIVDTRASWQTGPFTIFAYAQNVFDKFHITGWSDLRSNPNVEVATNDPREIGVGIEARF
jgi:outer membrane receptor protein involved in Fe transport